MKKGTVIFLMLLLIAMNSCNERMPNSNEMTSEMDKFPYLIDSSDFEVSDRHETWLVRTNYNLLYIGKYQDTVTVGYKFDFFYPPPPPPGMIPDEVPEKKTENPSERYYLIDWFDRERYQYWTKSKIEVKIDTSTVIVNYALSIDWYNPYFKAYPVILRNMETDTILIGRGVDSGNSIPLIMEAKDSLNNWRAIEEKLTYICGNGLGKIMLPPNEIVVTSAMIYNGHYKTDLRLKIGKNYSKPFKGTINYRQFDSMFNESGNYKKAYIEENKEVID